MKLTHASVFILPLIDSSFTKDNLLIDETERNKYIYTFSNAYLDGDKHILLSYITYKNNKCFHNLENRLKAHPLYVQTFSRFYDNVWHTVIKLRLPDNIKVALFCIKNSSYRSLSYSTKVRILQFWCSHCNSKLHAFLFDDNYKAEQFDNQVLPKDSYLIQERLRSMEPFLFYITYVLIQ